jgi:hypothetical protein
MAKDKNNKPKERPAKMNIPQVATRLREQMQEFLGKLPSGKVARRFALEAMYGIQTRQSLHLTEIARSLNENIPLIKTVNRLSRQAQRKNLHEEIARFVAEQGATYVKDRTLLLIDPSDIAKKYAEKMQYLARVRDGSEGKIANGYWLCAVLAVECEGRDLVPLANRLWSQNAPDFKSENDEILACIETVSKATGKRGVWVMDRGGDRIKLYMPLIQRDLDFIFRLVGNRDLVHNGQKKLASEIARATPLPYAETIVRENSDGTQTVKTIEFGYQKVKLPGSEKQLYMVVVKGFGQKPTLILTTVEARNSRRSLWWIVQAYLTRWRIEESLRFSKQSYDLEDIRVLNYESLRNMMGIVLLAMYFAMCHLGLQTKLSVLCHHSLESAKRLFGIARFRYYAIADGIREILSGRMKQVFSFDDHQAQGRAQPDFLDMMNWPTG